MTRGDAYAAARKKRLQAADIATTQDDPQRAVSDLALLTAAKCAGYAAPLRDAYRRAAQPGEPGESDLIESGYKACTAATFDHAAFARDASRMWATVALAAITTRALRAIWGGSLRETDAAVFDGLRAQLEEHFLAVGGSLRALGELPRYEDEKLACLALGEGAAAKAAAPPAAGVWQ